MKIQMKLFTHLFALFTRRRYCTRLFIYINDFVHELEKKWGGVTFPTRTIHALLFADDLVLLAPDPINLQQKIDQLSDFAGKNGLKVNLSKTKVMIFRKGGRLRKCDSFSYQKKPVEVVNSYCYLGVSFHNTGKFKKTAVEFKNKGMSAVGQVLAILYKFKIISLSSSKFIFRALAESCTLYCVSVWGHGNEDEIEKIQTGFYKRLYFLTTRTP